MVLLMEGVSSFCSQDRALQPAISSSVVYLNYLQCHKTQAHIHIVTSCPASSQFHLLQHRAWFTRLSALEQRGKKGFVVMEKWVVMLLA